MKKLLLVSAASLAAFLLFPRPATAQADPTAIRGSVLQAGVTYSNASSDLTSKRIAGMSVYATYDFYKNLGIEGNIRFLSLWTPQDFAERSYLIGLRYSRHYGRFQPYLRGSGGIGQTIAQESYVTQIIQDTPEHFAIYAIGGGLDMHLNRNLNLRLIDFEQQFWPHFDPHGITPRIASVGVAYRFH